MTTYNVEMNDNKWARVKIEGMPLERRKALYRAIYESLVLNDLGTAKDAVGDVWRERLAAHDREFHGERVRARAAQNWSIR